MSLYNMLFGVNKLTPVILKIAGLELNEIPRFRDCSIKEGVVVVYTRTGGGNRECYSENDDHSDCYHLANEELTRKSNYITDYDDEFDSTYAYFEFSPLPEYKDLVKEVESNNPSVGEKFKELFDGWDKRIEEDLLRSV